MVFLLKSFSDRCVMFSSLLFPAFFVHTVQAEPLSLQTDHALAIHLSNHGMDQLEDAVKRHLPTVISVTGGSSTLECSSDSALNYTVADIDVDINIDDIALTTAADTLQLNIYGSLNSNNVSIDLQGNCSVISDIAETCDLMIPTTSFQLGVSVEVNFADGELQVTSSPVEYSIAPIGNPLSNCILSDAVGTILAQQPTLLNDLILSELEDELVGIPATIEEGLSDITDDLTISESTNLLGTDFDIHLFPTAITVDDYGLWIGLGGLVETDIPEKSCVDPSQYFPTEESSWPTFNGQTLGSGIQYDAGIFVGRAFTDNLLYSLWASGTMCLDVAELAGLSLNGELAGAYFGSELTDLIGSSPIDLTLSLHQPPYVVFSDDQPPFGIAIEDFSLEVMGPVEERKTRILEVDIAADIGAYVTLDNNRLLLDVPLSTDNFTTEEAYSEFLSSGYSVGVPNLLELGLSAFSFSMPSYILPTPLHLEMGNLNWEPNAEDTWQGGYVFIQTDHIEAIDVPGCSVSDFGCGSSPSIDIDVEEEFGCSQDFGGCEGSCASTGPVKIPMGRLLGIFFLVCGTLLRRRM